jgi:hypothetical protein
VFLLKTVFWLSVVLFFLIPVGKEIGTAEKGGGSRVETLSAARAVWSDLSTFCERNQETCETGNRLVAEFGDKARIGAKMLYVYLDGHFGPNSADASPVQ